MGLNAVSLSRPPWWIASSPTKMMTQVPTGLQKPWRNAWGTSSCSTCCASNLQGLRDRRPPMRSTTLTERRADIACRALCSMHNLMVALKNQQKLTDDNDDEEQSN